VEFVAENHSKTNNIICNFAAQLKYNMTTQQLHEQILQKKSFLCVGLDPDLTKIPPHLLETEDPIFEFNKAIIDATHDLTIGYKPNTAFFEAYGIKGWMSLQKTINYINENFPEIFTIADAKRGDIGNTSSMYAKAFFEDLKFDSVTVAPYMGKDSVEPFLAFENKHTIMLALTSNEGAFDFQTLTTNGKELYKQVLETSRTWKNSENLMYVVGATKAEYFADIRKIVPDSFLLVPGIGAQGGSLSEVCKYGMNDKVGLLVNSARAIIYASKETDFAEKAREEALKVQQEMEKILSSRFQV
jgi:orotidine-5'-phosphate decarboxylase